MACIWVGQSLDGEDSDDHARDEGVGGYPDEAEACDQECGAEGAGVPAYPGS